MEKRDIWYFTFGVFCLVLLTSGGVFAKDFLIRNESNSVSYLVVNGTSGFVGVGVNSALEELEVDGNINVMAGNDICTEDGSCLSSSLPVCSDGETFVYNSTSSAWQCGVGGAEVAIGTVQAFAQNTCPDYWIAADGSNVSRFYYSDLYEIIGELYGDGDGATTFNVPDYRGYFLRGWDNGAGVDPDAGSRTDSGDGSTTGDNVGTKQGDAAALPVNDFTTDVEANHAHRSTAAISDSVGVYSGSVNYAATTGSSTGNSGSHTHDTSSGGDSETRPVNINVLYCIRALEEKNFEIEEDGGGDAIVYSQGGSIVMQLG